MNSNEEFYKLGIHLIRSAKSFQLMMRSVGSKPNTKRLLDSFEYGRERKNQNACLREYNCAAEKEPFCEEITYACPVLKVKIDKIIWQFE